MRIVRTLCVLCFLCLSIQAADPTGSIAGTVVDPSGAALVGAKVTATAPATGLSRETTTATDGGYVFPLLPVGVYTVVIEASGFKRSEQRGIEVRANVTVTVPITLQLGQLSDSITVEANADLVDTRSGTLRQTVDQRNIVELPLNGRNAATLVLLAPGTTDLNAGNARGSGDAMQGATYPGAQSISANGSRSDGLNYQLDGGSNIDHYTNVNNPFPNPDALEEFSVQTNNYSAEHGRASGAVVNIVTKSGTNSLHGTVFEFLRNGAMNARNFFAPVGDKLKRNQFGGSVGGPIVKDKLFFFGTYQGTQLRNIASGLTTTVLTPAQRDGDFSNLSRQLVDPVSRAPIPRNQIPASQVDGVAKKLLPLIPLPTAANGFRVFDRPVLEHENQFMGRVDYNLAKQRVYGRYFYAKLPRDAVSGAQDLVRGTGGREFFSQSASVSHTYNLSSTLLNNFIFSYNYNNGQALSGAPFSLPSIGVAIASPTPPEINVQVAGFFTLSSGAAGEFKRQNQHFAESLHWIRGTHELSFGGDFLNMKVDLNNSYRQAGRFRFRGGNYSGNALSDFMLGRVERFIQGGGEYAARRGKLGSLFAQDNIRVSRQFNLTLGLRWDPFVPYSDERGRTECYLAGVQSTRFTKAPRGYLYAGDAQCPAGGSQSSWKQLSPRIGFAYSLPGQSKTTLRGGFGLFYQPPFVEAYNNMVDSAPFSPQFFLFGVPFANPYAGLRNVFSSSTFFPSQPPPPASDVDFEKPVLAVSYAPDWHPARVLSWNLTLERQLRGDLLARAAYVGSKGTHLGFNTDLNPARFGPGANGGNTQDRRPNQDFQTITQDVSGGNSIYNSLQLGLDKRFSRGFTAGLNYTFSRSLDWVSYLTDLDGINVVNPYNARAYRGVSDFNTPHRLVANYLWRLPSPKGSAWTRHLLGNWETSGIWNWQSGFPLTITTGDDLALSGLGNDLPDVVSKPSLTSGTRGQRIAKWFTTEAFKNNAAGTFGNAGRNILTGPGTFNLDFSAHKTFPFSERWKLQYRAEFFNFFNHTLLRNPDSSLSSGTYGSITGARDGRIIQMALKLSW
ncbi:MAG: TonB-dependent receptor [Acidobacteria bacterium]|nr:TonB-dependent receptor [Acidobacteriota bacterium]